MTVFTSITDKTITIATDFVLIKKSTALDAAMEELNIAIPGGTWYAVKLSGSWVITNREQNAHGMNRNWKVALSQATNRAIVQMVPLAK